MRGQVGRGRRVLQLQGRRHLGQFNLHRGGIEGDSAGLRVIAKPLIPPPKARPQGAGTRYMPDDRLFVVVNYALANGCTRWPCRRVSALESDWRS